MSNKNNFKISSILYALGSILSASISFIFIPFFMSEFTSVEFGIYSLILICSSIGAAIFYLGVTSALTRSFFDFTGNNERNNCFFTALVLLAFGGVMQIVLGFFVSNGISLLLFNSINWNNAILIALISSSFGFINFAFLTYFRLVNKPYHFFTFSVLSVVGNMLGMYLFVIIEKQGVLGAIKGPLISQVLMFIIFLIYHWKLLSRAKYSKIEGVVQLKYGFYTVLSSLGGLAILWADQFFINKYLNLSDVGVYALSVKLAGIITVVFVTPFIQVFNPIVMEQRSKVGVKELISKSYDIYIVSGLFISILIAFSVEEFIYVFDKNNNYFKSINYIFPLMFSICIYGLVNIVSIGLSFERKLGRQTIVFLFFSIVNVFLNLALIPTFGIWGAIFSTFVTYLLITIALGIASNKVYKIVYSSKATCFVSLGAIVFSFFNMYYIVGSELYYRLIYKAMFLVFLTLAFYFYINKFEKIKIFCKSNFNKENI